MQSIPAHIRAIEKPRPPYHSGQRATHERMMAPEKPCDHSDPSDSTCESRLTPAILVWFSTEIYGLGRDRQLTDGYLMSTILVEPQSPLS